MPPVLNVYALPRMASPEELAGGTAVVIDVLRATTTVVHAVASGAREVIPCLEVEEARRIAAGFPPGGAVLGGERKGLPIEGFDLGNSPSEYTPQTVGGRTVVFTTTNGTPAMAACRHAEQVLIGAFVNARAIVERLTGRERLYLVCSGTRGEIGRDDVLMAGLLVERLQRQSGTTYQLNAQAITARENWLSSFSVPVAVDAEPMDPELLIRELRKSPGGRNLTAIGREDDIAAAAELDRFDCVPEMDPKTMHIRLTPAE
jgi:2-phosphosulfolactate phosphatase